MSKMKKINMNTFKILLMSIIALSVIVAGCSEDSGNNGSSGLGELDQYRGGTESVSVEIESGSPPETVYDNSTDPFSIAMEISNIGEWDIPTNSLKIALEGFGSSLWGNVNNTLVLSDGLEGYNSRDDIEGESRYISFDNIEYKGALNQNSFTQNYKIDTCYSYGTRVAFSACVNNDVRRGDDTNSELCQGFSNRDYSVSGGLIGVSEIEQQVVNGKLRLLFTIDNLAFQNSETSIYSPNSLNQECNIEDGLSSSRVKDVVSIELNNPVIGDFSCNNDGKVRFPEQERRIRCEADISTLDVQEVPMILRLEYEVKQSLRDTLIVRKE